MDLHTSNRTSRPGTSHQQSAAPMAAPAAHVRAAAMPRAPKPAVPKWVIASGAVVVLLAGLIWWHTTGTTAPRSDRYQAVFMENDQVFFGKLKNMHGDYLRLETAYSTRQTEGSGGAASEDNIALVKVNDLVYGPEDVMMLRADKVKFWQDLKVDSKVTKAIEAKQQN